MSLIPRSSEWHQSLLRWKLNTSLTHSPYRGRYGKTLPPRHLKTLRRSKPLQMQLKEFRALVNKRIESSMHLYIERVKRGSISLEPKELNDPVWGTITLTPLEVLFLDSPLMQRLRYIKQLGVVHWVYPGT